MILWLPTLDSYSYQRDKDDGVCLHLAVPYMIGSNLQFSQISLEDECKSGRRVHQKASFTPNTTMQSGLPRNKEHDGWRGPLGSLLEPTKTTPRRHRWLRKATSMPNLMNKKQQSSGNKPHFWVLSLSNQPTNCYPTSKKEKRSVPLLLVGSFTQQSLFLHTWNASFQTLSEICIMCSILKFVLLLLWQSNNYRNLLGVLLRDLTCPKRVAYLRVL